MNRRKKPLQVLFVGLVAFSVWALLIPTASFWHEIGHAIVASLFGVQVLGISPDHVVTGPIDNPSILLVTRSAGGIFQALFPTFFFICVDRLARNNPNFMKRYRLALLTFGGFEIALLTHVIYGAVNGAVEGFFPQIYSAIYNNLILWISVFLISATISCIWFYTKRIGPMKDVWVFGYGSLVWDKSGIVPIKVKSAKLEGWHRDWTWISKRRHGAPTCSLQPEGGVKGIFMKLNPKTQASDLETLRNRERRKTEVVESVSGIIGKTHFWTMGSNLDEHDEIRNLKGIELYRALARKAKDISEKGPDGETATGYAFLVHEFDPDDQITKMYTDEIRKLDLDKRQEVPSQTIKVIESRIQSLKANRNFFTILLTIESAILTVMFTNLTSILHRLGISILLLSASLVLMLLGAFTLTDSIHFYSKYIEYRFAWKEMVHGLAYPIQSREQKAVGDFKRALEADDIGYYYLKLSLLSILWFLASLVLAVPSEFLDSTSRMSVFVITLICLTLTAVKTYKHTHHKSFLKSFKDFFKRKPVFNDS